MTTVGDQKRFMQRFVNFINTASESLSRELVASDAKFYVPGQTEPLIGPDGYMAVIGMMRSGFPDVQWTLEETVMEPGKVAARYSMRGTHKGTFLGVPASGKTIEVQAINIYHFCDGMIIGEIGQPDLLGIMQQIGALGH